MWAKPSPPKLQSAGPRAPRKGAEKRAAGTHGDGEDGTPLKSPRFGNSSQGCSTWTAASSSLTFFPPSGNILRPRTTSASPNGNDALATPRSSSAPASINLDVTSWILNHSRLCKIRPLNTKIIGQDTGSLQEKPLLGFRGEWTPPPSLCKRPWPLVTDGAQPCDGDSRGVPAKCVPPRVRSRSPVVRRSLPGYHIWSTSSESGFPMDFAERSSSVNLTSLSSSRLASVMDFTDAQPSEMEASSGGLSTMVTESDLSEAMVSAASSLGVPGHSSSPRTGTNNVWLSKGLQPLKPDLHRETPSVASQAAAAEPPTRVPEFDTPSDNSSGESCVSPSLLNPFPVSHEFASPVANESPIAVPDAAREVPGDAANVQHDNSSNPSVREDVGGYEGGHSSSDCSSMESPRRPQVQDDFEVLFLPRLAPGLRYGFVVIDTYNPSPSAVHLESMPDFSSATPQNTPSRDVPHQNVTDGHEAPEDPSDVVPGPSAEVASPPPAAAGAAPVVVDLTTSSPENAPPALEAASVGHLSPPAEATPTAANRRSSFTRITPAEIAEMLRRSNDHCESSSDDPSNPPPLSRQVLRVPVAPPSTFVHFASPARPRPRRSFFRSRPGESSTTPSGTGSE